MDILTLLRSPLFAVTFEEDRNPDAASTFRSGDGISTQGSVGTSDHSEGSPSGSLDRDSDAPQQGSTDGDSAARSVEEIEVARSRAINRLLQEHNRRVGGDRRAFAKKDVLPYFFRVKEQDPQRFAAWQLEPQTEALLYRYFRMKPRRTASGVATITVLTKPWTCSSACVYCPNDVRMPKSYLANEPACQRAERNCFDPYLQVHARLHVLAQMGHDTDKVELIVLGGTWSDYPEAYQTWFMAELFRALNDGDTPEAEEQARRRRMRYETWGVKADAQALASDVAIPQSEVDTGARAFNSAIHELYDESPAWQQAAQFQQASLEELESLQRQNETADHRCVGLVIETRPDLIDAPSLWRMRQFGCTKVQMGIQSLDPAILRENHRRVDIAQIQQAFALLRLFGFKIHIHFMVNLVGATPEADKEDYRQLVSDPHYLPDEVKLYPCVLVESSALTELCEQGHWKAYAEEELVEVLAADILATPPYTRISRMIRDISASDILEGNKKTNLRQLVEQQIERKSLLPADEVTTVSTLTPPGSSRMIPSTQGLTQPIEEIRYREINRGEVDERTLELQDVAYETTVSQEHFLQWVTPEGQIAGFLRLTLPKEPVVKELGDSIPVERRDAMIREVHVYGVQARLHESGTNAQHRGLGRTLVDRACAIASDAGCSRIKVISAVGTRGYYHKLGFEDAGLYQQRLLSR